MRNLDPEEMRDMAIAEAARRHAAAIRTNIRADHQQTLATLANDFAYRVSQPDVTEQLIRASESCGTLMAGQIVRDLIQKGIDAEAEIEAIKEVERAEAAVPAGERQRMNVMQVRREVNAAYCGFAVVA